MQPAVQVLHPARLHTSVSCPNSSMLLSYLRNIILIFVHTDRHHYLGDLLLNTNLNGNLGIALNTPAPFRSLLLSKVEPG